MGLSIVYMLRTKPSWTLAGQLAIKYTFVAQGLGPASVFTCSRTVTLIRRLLQRRSTAEAAAAISEQQQEHTKMTAVPHDAPVNAGTVTNIGTGPGLWRLETKRSLGLALAGSHKINPLTGRRTECFASVMLCRCLRCGKAVWLLQSVNCGGASFFFSRVFLIVVYESLRQSG